MRDEFCDRRGSKQGSESVAAQFGGAANITPPSSSTSSSSSSSRTLLSECSSSFLPAPAMSLSSAALPSPKRDFPYYKYIKLISVCSTLFIVFLTLSGYTTHGVNRKLAGLERFNFFAISSSGSGLRMCAVVYGGYIYLSSDRGSTWAITHTLTNRNWYAVASSRDGLRVTAAVKGGYVYSSVITNDVAVWMEHSNSEALPGSRNWQSVTSSGDGKMIAAAVQKGFIYTAVCDALGTWTWTAHDGTLRGEPGVRDWTTVSSNQDGSRLVAAASNGYVYLYGQQRWSEITSAGAQAWTSISNSLSGQTVAACVRNGNVYISQNYGNSFTLYADPPGSRTWRAVLTSTTGVRVFAIDEDGYMFKASIIDGRVIWTAQRLGERMRWHALTVVERISLMTFIIQ